MPQYIPYEFQETKKITYNRSVKRILWDTFLESVRGFYFYNQTQIAIMGAAILATIVTMSFF